MICVFSSVFFDNLFHYSILPLIVNLLILTWHWQMLQVASRRKVLPSVFNPEASEQSRQQQLLLMQEDKRQLLERIETADAAGRDDEVGGIARSMTVEERGGGEERAEIVGGEMWYLRSVYIHTSRALVSYSPIFFLNHNVGLLETITAQSFGRVKQ